MTYRIFEIFPSPDRASGLEPVGKVDNETLHGTDAGMACPFSGNDCNGGCDGSGEKDRLQILKGCEYPGLGMEFFRRSLLELPEHGDQKDIKSPLLPPQNCFFSSLLTLSR
jgi:hypothetical protein